MEHQIARIPYKYWELIDTMSNEDCWRLMKALFKKSSEWLDWLCLTYYNIIIVDIQNLEKQVEIWKRSWKKGWRPKKNNPGVINKKTPPLWNKKPKVSKDKIRQDNTSKDKVSYYWELENVPLTETDVSYLEQNYWKANTDIFIDKVSLYIESSGKKYKSYKAAIINFMRKDWIVKQEKWKDILKFNLDELLAYSRKFKNSSEFIRKIKSMDRNKMSDEFVENVKLVDDILMKEEAKNESSLLWIWSE